MDTAILIPIFGIIFGCGIALLAIWTGYKRDMILIEKGLYQPDRKEPVGPPGWGFLTAGLILAGIGVGLVASAFAFKMGGRMGVAGFLFLFVGAALLIAYFVARGKKSTPGN